MASTEYIVLQGQGPTADEKEVWEVYATVTATSAKKAVQAAAPYEAGTYAAVPRRNFQTVTVEVESTPRVRIVG